MTVPSVTTVTFAALTPTLISHDVIHEAVNLVHGRLYLLLSAFSVFSVVSYMSVYYVSDLFCHLFHFYRTRGYLHFQYLTEA